MDKSVYCNTDKRIFYLADGVDEQSIGMICFSLLSLLAEDQKKEDTQKDFKREPIKFYIQSFGGSVYDMWALIEILLNSKTPIHTYSMGYSMSAGLDIFLAGHKRFATKHSVFLYHQLSAWDVNGKYQDIVEYQHELDKQQEEIEKYITERTKITPKKLADIRKAKEDWYIRYEEAIELGIATDIIDKF